MKDIEDQISKFLRERQTTNVIDDKLILSAVLIPICKSKKELSILFTKRPKTLKRHAGQISFPGGIFEAGDKNIEKTAIRETCEELGINKKSIRLLGRIDDMATLTGYLITPFVGVLTSPYKININRKEIEELIIIPLIDLINISPRTEIITYRGISHPTYYYDYKNWVIWGATARMLKNFLELVSRIGKNLEEGRL